MHKNHALFLPLMRDRSAAAPSPAPPPPPPPPPPPQNASSATSFFPSSLRARSAFGDTAREPQNEQTIIDLAQSDDDDDISDSHRSQPSPPSPPRQNASSAPSLFSSVSRARSAVGNTARWSQNERTIIDLTQSDDDDNSGDSNRVVLNSSAPSSLPTFKMSPRNETFQPESSPPVGAVAEGDTTSPSHSTVTAGAHVNNTGADGKSERNEAPAPCETGGAHPRIKWNQRALQNQKKRDQKRRKR